MKLSTMFVWMKKNMVWLLIVALLPISAGCTPQKETVWDATEYGVSPTNSGQQNSENLQKLIDKISQIGGSIYIPAGEYLFAENGTQTIGSHCIKMKSNVSIFGDGEKTVLKPVGQSAYGMDMFYFNDYLDTGEPVYLTNCTFRDFVIDADGTSCLTYTSAGKGFMFNLFRNCHWQNVTVKNTDATGFGVDCPIDSSISKCVAIGCGKAATVETSGASGFGIGYGYSAEESIKITDCRAVGNKKFGFFFEHQGRFNRNMYTADTAVGFRVTDCIAEGNLYNFGAIAAFGGVYENCTSQSAIRAGYYFEDSADFTVSHCTSMQDGEAGLSVYASENPLFTVQHILVENCVFTGITDYCIYTSGKILDLTLTNNQSDSDRLYLDSVENCRDMGNSWK